MVSQQPFATPGQVHCRLCGRPMDRNMAAMRNNVCQAPACDAERTREAARTIQQRDWDQYRAATAYRLGKAAPQIAALSERTGCALDEMKVQMLPRQTRPMTGPDPDQREAFVAYLRRIVDESFAREPEPTRAPGRARHDQPEPAAVYASCSTCKGDCCNLGGDHNAFLNADVISEFRALHPDWDADRIFDSYTERLAEVTPLGSCQFHGPQGCTLQRDQRAQLCNSHHCRPLKYLLHLDGVIGDAPVALVALDEDGDGIEAAFLDGDEWRDVDVSDAGAVDQSRQDEIVGHGMGWLPGVSPMIQPIHRPDPSARACKWCGTPIGVNEAATTRSCGSQSCEHQRIAELARGYGTGRAEP